MLKILEQYRPSPSLVNLLFRFSLSLTFVWFGALKLFGVSPVRDLVLQSMPHWLSSLPFFFPTLAIFEIVIGMGLLFKKTTPVAAVVMIGHLLVATGSVLINQGFAPTFPLLTFAGEFVAKNLVLIAGGVLLLAKEPNNP